MPKYIKPYIIYSTDSKQARQIDEMFGIIFEHLGETSATVANVRHITVPSFSTAETVMIMDGTASFVVPEEMDNYTLTTVLSTVYLSASGDTKIQLRLSRMNEAETERTDSDLFMDGEDPDYLIILAGNLYGEKTNLKTTVKKGDILFIDVDDTSGDALALFSTLSFEG